MVARVWVGFGLLALDIFWAQLGFKFGPFNFTPNTIGFGPYYLRGQGKASAQAGPGIGL